MPENILQQVEKLRSPILQRSFGDARHRRIRSSKSGKIKVLVRVTRDSSYEYWLGGDRVNPDKIYECPIAEDRSFARLEAIGPGEDDWIFSIKRILNNVQSAITLYGSGEQYIYNEDPALVSTVRYAGGGVWSNFLIRSMDETLGVRQTIRNAGVPAIGYPSLFDTHPFVVSGAVGIGPNTFYSWSIANVVGSSPGGTVNTYDAEFVTPYILAPGTFATLNFDQRGEQRTIGLLTTTTRPSQNAEQADFLTPYAACPPTPGASAIMQAGQQSEAGFNDFNANFETNAFSILLHKGQKNQSTGYYRHTRNVYETHISTRYFGRDVTILQSCITFGSPTGRIGLFTVGSFIPQNTWEQTSFLDTETFDTDINVLLLPGQSRKYKDKRERTGTTGYGSGPTIYERKTVVDGNIYGDALATFWGETTYDQNLSITSDVRFLRIGTTDYPVTPIDADFTALFSTQNKLLTTFSQAQGGFSLYRCSTIDRPPEAVTDFANITLDDVKNTILSEDVVVNVSKWDYASGQMSFTETFQETVLNMADVNSSVNNIFVLAVQYYPS